MTKERVLSLSASRREDIIARFRVKKLAVFGSAARDDMRNDSDVDILVEFQEAATFEQIHGSEGFSGNHPRDVR